MSVINSERVRSSRLGAIMIASTLTLTMLVACGGSSNPSTQRPTLASATSPSAGGSATPSAATSTPVSQPTATSTAASAATATPTAGSGATAVSTGSPTPETGATPPAYLDDRSSAEEVILSYYNAINTRQYARAYSYWMPGTSASQLPPFEQFQQGYATTLLVDVTFGTVSDGVAAGNIYYAVPVELVSKTSDKGVLTYVGCYTLHLGNPANYAFPPVDPMAIQSADISQVVGGANPEDLLARACSGQPGSGSGMTVTPPSNPNDISVNNYLDDRSDGAAVIGSFYNAINRKEYARAYSYWEPSVDPSMLPPFPQFEQGYAQTASVALTIGTVTIDAGAGQRYASVPATIIATMTDGSTQTFVGCYVTHLASPDIQTEPPFHPMSIARANVTRVDNGADTSSLMASACRP